MEQQQQNQNLAFPIPKRSESDQTTKWKIDPEDVIKEIIHYLRGDFFDDQELAWKPQGFIYDFSINAPQWVHQGLLNLEAKGGIRFDIAIVDQKTGIGTYSVYDIDSFNNIMTVIDAAKEEINTRKLKDQVTFTYNKSEPQRLLNEAGIRVISTTLRGYLNKNIILSSLEKDMINKIALENAIEVIRVLFMSHDHYGIDKRNLSTILRVIDVNVYTALLRAKEGFFVNHLSTTQRYIEQSNINTVEKENDKKKFLPSIFGSWGNKE